MTIGEAQKTVDDWIKKYGVRYFSDLTNMAILTEEVGEVAKIIARQYGDQSYKRNDVELNLNDELADVLLFCYVLRIRLKSIWNLLLNKILQKRQIGIIEDIYRTINFILKCNKTVHQ